MIRHLLLDEDDSAVQIVHVVPGSSKFLLGLCFESRFQISDFPCEHPNFGLSLGQFVFCLVRFRIRRNVERARLLIGIFEVLAQIISVSDVVHGTSFGHERVMTPGYS